MTAENANTANDINIIDKSAIGNIPPYFNIKLTNSETKSIVAYVLINHASQLMPLLRPIAFIVLK